MRGGDLGVRALTGTALVAVTVSAIWFGAWSYAFLIALVFFIGCSELESAWRLIHPESGLLKRWLGSMALVGIPALALLQLGGWGEAYDPRLPLGWFALMWTNDSGAYIAGRSFGKHKLAPQISPGKTWEGWAGGLLFTVALGWYLQGSLGLECGLMLAAVVSLLGPLGDLAESFLKRKAGIKDSGHVLPGHGGVLDRFDSHLFSAPVAALFLLIF